MNIWALEQIYDWDLEGEGECQCCAGAVLTGYKRGLAAAFGIAGMAEAIQTREDEKTWDAVEAEDARQRAETEARRDEDMRREREAWRYARD